MLLNADAQYVHSMLYNTFILCLAIVIGFDRNQYSIIESTSAIPIMIRRTNVILSEAIVVTTSTVDITAECKLIHCTLRFPNHNLSLISASGEPDYEAQNLNITFSRENAEQTVVIGIFNDTYLELNETFNCTLSLVAPNDPSIQLNPDVATVTIINDDRELVYTVIIVLLVII